MNNLNKNNLHLCNNSIFAGCVWLCYFLNYLSRWNYYLFFIYHVYRVTSFPGLGLVLPSFCLAICTQFVGTFLLLFWSFHSKLMRFLVQKLKKNIESRFQLPLDCSHKNQFIKNLRFLISMKTNNTLIYDHLPLFFFNIFIFSKNMMQLINYFFLSETS